MSEGVVKWSVFLKQNDSIFVNSPLRRFVAIPCWRRRRRARRARQTRARQRHNHHQPAHLENVTKSLFGMPMSTIFPISRE
jgi:hypothetical protein